MTLLDPNEGPSFEFRITAIFFVVIAIAFIESVLLNGVHH